MTKMQWLIWSLAATGKFFEGYVVFMTGVALPLISREFETGSAEHGLVGAASLLGILIGAVGLGGMSDRFGRKPMFIIEMVIFVAFLVLLVLSANFWSVIICLFGIGLALGCDYPTAHMIISENIPSISRGRLVLAAFGFQALGALGGTLVGYVVLSVLPELSAWRWMYATAVIPALAVTIGRFYVTESANWLLARGATQRAQQAAMRLLIRRPQYPSRIVLSAALRQRQKTSPRIGDSLTCSHRKTGAQRSSPPSRGFCRISEPMASAFLRRPSWPRRLGGPWSTCAASVT